MSRKTKLTPKRVRIIALLAVVAVAIGVFTPIVASYLSKPALVTAYEVRLGLSKGQRLAPLAANATLHDMLLRSATTGERQAFVVRQARTVEAELGFSDVPVYLALNGECGGGGDSISCEKNVLGAPALFLTPTAFYDLSSADAFDQMVAHELVHTRQSVLDEVYFATHPAPWEGIHTGGDPAGEEGTAECGSYLLLHSHGLDLDIDSQVTSDYLDHPCNATQNALAQKVLAGRQLW